MVLKFLRGDVAWLSVNVYVYFVRVEDIIKEDWFNRVDWCGVMYAISTC